MPIAVHRQMATALAAVLAAVRSPACKDHSAVGVTCPLLVAAVSSSPRVTAAFRLPPLDRARSGHAAAVFKTGAVLSISRHISCANGRHLLPHLAVIPRISRGLRMLAVL